MAQISTNDIRAGAKLEIDGQPYAAVSNEFVKPGKGQAFNRIRIRHLKTGRVVEKTFKSGEKIDVADIAESQMRMLYREQDGVIFMDDTSFEQIKISLENIGETDKWLMDDLIYEVLFYKGEPITVEPPTFMDMKIVETTPGDRGNTASGRVLKPAKVTSGATIQVPIFINEGELIRVDTRTGEYVSRVNG